MTQLTGRPATRPRSGAASATTRTAHPAPARPLTRAVAIAAVLASVGSLVCAMALALVGWFLAASGGYGQTTDALRVGAHGWLLGHGTTLTVGGTPIGVIPLGLVLIFAAVSYRCGRRAARNATTVDDDRTFAIVAAIYAGIYLVVGVLTAVFAVSGDVRASIPRAIVGILLVGALPGVLGLAHATKRFDVWLNRLPWLVREISRGAVTAALAVVAAASILATVAMALGLNEASSMMAAMKLSNGDATMYTIVAAALAPNAIGFGAAYMFGPGFAIGTGTVVSPSAVSLGPLPAFPLLAGLPGEGVPPGYLMAVIAVPALLTLLAVMRVQRYAPTTMWERGAVRGFCAGLGAAVLITAFVAVSGGSMGTGRMAQIGAPLWETLLAAVASLGVAGLVGGVIATFWQRRAERRGDLVIEEVTVAGVSDRDSEVTERIELEEDTVKLDLADD